MRPFRIDVVKVRVADFVSNTIESESETHDDGQRSQAKASYSRLQALSRRRAWERIDFDRIMFYNATQEARDRVYALFRRVVCVHKTIETSKVKGVSLGAAGKQSTLEGVGETDTLFLHQTKTRFSFDLPCGERKARPRDLGQDSPSTFIAASTHLKTTKSAVVKSRG